MDKGTYEGGFWQDLRRWSFFGDRGSGGGRFFGDENLVWDFGDLDRTRSWVDWWVLSLTSHHLPYTLQSLWFDDTRRMKN